jgi:predicted short-subunit dehydrogenase-like oxidoreductase (DUF2520 family)
MFERDSTRIGFVGAGRLAASLASALHRAGYCVSAVSSLRLQSARALAHATGAGPATTADEVAGASDFVFLTVPDAAIAKVARRTQWRSGQAVVHCSGALDLEVLAPAVEAGGLAGCFHPLQSFPSREGDAERFRSITCGIEASGELAPALDRIARDLGSKAVRLEGIDRAKYHAAAVFASNYVVSLFAAAEEVWEQAGLPRASARPALAPLLLGAAENAAGRELADALTGPVARGDIATIERHLAALEGPGVQDLYRRLALELLTLDLGHTPEVLSRLRAALGQAE